MYCFILLLLLTNSNGQITKKNQFYIDTIRVEYNSFTKKATNNKFYIVVLDNKAQLLDFEKNIKNCIKSKPNASIIYYLAIPKEFEKQKESFVLEYISEILSKKKLIDKDMNIIANKDYFKLYEETRIKNKGKYKNSFLNKISNLILLKINDNLCSFIN